LFTDLEYEYEYRPFGTEYEYEYECKFKDFVEMKKIGIVANLVKANARERAGEIARRLEDSGAGAVFERELAVALGREDSAFDLETAGEGVSALVVLGGDGTLIRTFRRLRNKEIPLLGINLGGLGFLTEVRLDDLDRALDDLLAGRLKVEKRMTLDGSCRRPGREPAEFTALNEIVVGKGGLARVIKMEAFLDGDYLTAYMADGLIIATPTGSTGYSLSAQGPILSPGTGVILLNPICPHTLTNRPIIIGGERTIRIVMKTAPAETSLTVDGQFGFALQPGDEITARRGADCLRLLTDPVSNYYAILRNKLNWGGRSHYHG
jgi:NAD+ kinase